MDECDMSDDRIQAMIDQGIQRVRAKLERALPSIGICHWCESPVMGGRIFCSKECSDDWDARQEARKRNGE